MPKPTNYDRIIQQLTSGLNGKYVDRWFYKNSLTSDASGAPVFMWRATGIPGAGAVPATGVGTVPTSSTQGSMIVRNAGAGEGSYLTEVGYGQATSLLTSNVWLVDILWFNSGLSGTVTTAQTINSTALSRYTGADSAGNYLGLICWTATGSTASNVTTSYTNQNGTSGRTSTSTVLWTGYIGGGVIAPTANQFQVLPLQSGDTGIRSIETLTLSADTLTAGDFGACIFRLLAHVSTPPTLGAFTTKDYTVQTPNIPQKLDNACLAFIAIPIGTSTGLIHGKVQFVEA